MMMMMMMMTTMMMMMMIYMFQQKSVSTPHLTLQSSSNVKTMRKVVLQDSYFSSRATSWHDALWHVQLEPPCRSCRLTVRGVYLRGGHRPDSSHEELPKHETSLTCANQALKSTWRLSAQQEPRKLALC